jgi:hypothetical protein
MTWVPIGDGQWPTRVIRSPPVGPTDLDGLLDSYPLAPYAGTVGQRD